MSSSVCSQCGQPLTDIEGDLPGDALALCAICREIGGPDGVEHPSTGRTTASDDPLLPGKKTRGKDEPKSGLLPPRKTASEATGSPLPATASSTASPGEASGLLPPRKTRIDESFHRNRDVGPDRAWVLLPDGKGGFVRVNNSVVRVNDCGEQVVLKSRTRSAALRHRILVNLLAILVGLLVLFLVFWMGIHGYI